MVLDHVLFAIGNALIAAAVALLGELRSPPTRLSTRIRNFFARFGTAMLGLTGVGLALGAANIFSAEVGGWILPWWAAKSLSDLAAGAMLSGMIGIAVLSGSLVIPAAAEPRIETQTTQPTYTTIQGSQPEQRGEAARSVESEYRRRLRRSV